MCSNLGRLFPLDTACPPSLNWDRANDKLPGIWNS